MDERAGKWTVAVYLAGGDNVSREMIPALHDMRDAALANRSSLRVLAQFEPDHSAPRVFAFGWCPSSRDERHGAPTRFRSSTALGLESHQWSTSGGEEDANLSSTRRLEGFVQTATAVAAEDYLMLVISGHGSGAVGEFLGYRANQDPMSLQSLRAALAVRGAASRKIDIVGMDCCNMSMVEVGFELSDYARFMVASEGYILNHGWPYRPILDAIADLAPETVGAEIVRQFVGSYSDYALVNVASHSALTSLDRIHLLAEPVRRLSQLLIASIDDPDVWRPTVLAHWEAQSYKDEEYVDLGDFCDRLRAHIADPAVQSACSATLDALGQVVVLSCVSGSTFQYSTGLSVYFPWCHDAVKRPPDSTGTSPLESYQKLEFSRQTGWGEFLDAYLVATRREPPRRRVGSYPASEACESMAIRPSVQRAETLAVRRSSRRGRPEASRSPIDNDAVCKQKEAFMEIKRFPPWSTKGGATRPTVKNHPQSERNDVALPIRRFPPWSTKGSAVAPSVVKNHPHTR